MSTPISRSALRCIPIYLLILLSIITQLLTLAAPIEEKKSDSDKELSQGNRPSKVSAPAGIAGAFLIIIGLFLCFGATVVKPAKKFVVFLVGFFFFANLTYITMANVGVKAAVWLLVGPLLVGCFLGGLRMFKRPGKEVLGPIAIHCFSLWILSMRRGGLITSGVAQTIVLVLFDVMGFMFVFLTDAMAAKVGFSMLGAYTFIAGTDFFARSGFLQQADSIINSKNDYDPTGRSEGAHGAMLSMIAILAIAGFAVQFKWGNPEFKFDKNRKEVERGVGHVVWHGLKALLCCAYTLPTSRRN
ncbi:MAG: hypothetical protein J3Q66DRAFT_395147 [Benniella sp.]|nr:MAG: hypothetical protein J3Q66DRAFT_395147 [Benniella sp.]